MNSYFSCNNIYFPAAGTGPPVESKILAGRRYESPFSVEELLNLVINCGKDIDEAVNQLESLSEVVKRGMEQAQDELSKEAEDQLWQEGLLRYQIRTIIDSILTN